MLIFKVQNQSIKLIETLPPDNSLVSGTVKEYKCKFEFDDTWIGYGKTAWFRISDECGCGDYGKPVPIPLGIDDTCEIPDGVLQPLSRIRIGVSGAKDGKTRPTVYSAPLLVRIGATGEVPCPDTDVYENIIQIVEDAKAIAQSVRDDADAGKFNGEQGPAGQGVVKGGTAGQVLAKKSDADYDTEWVNAGSIGEIKAEEVSAVVPIGLPKDTPENVQGVADALMNEKQPKDFIVKTNYMDIPNHSSQEIYEAYRAGKNVKLIRNGQEYRLTSSISARANFKALTFAPTQINQVTVVIEGKQLIAKSVSFTPLAENVTATVPASLPTETEQNVQAVVNALAEKAETNNTELNKKQPKGDYALKSDIKPLMWNS